MRLGLILLNAIALAARLLSAPATVAGKSQLKVGVAAVSITPFGPNPDWDGTITDSGVWGERFQDLNHNGRWDPGELLPELFYGVEKHHRADC